MKRKLSFLLVICMLAGGVCTAFAEETTAVPIAEAAASPELGAGCSSVLLMEKETGEVLYEKEADKKVPIASVTKVMTILLVVEAIDSGRIQKTDVVTVSENAAKKGGSQIYLEVGEQMSVHDLLKAVVVASANDGAVALGEFLSGSETVFVEAMNHRAQQLGLEVNFVNPTGLDDESCHVLSARDVAVISRELISHEWIKEYTTIWMDSVREGAFGLTNTNRLVRFYEGTTGLKTGSTSKAKYCISATAKRGEMELIAVVLGGETSDRRFAAAKELFDYGFANYALHKPQVGELENMQIYGGTADATSLALQGGGLLVKKQDAQKISEEIVLPEYLIAPVALGANVGEVIYRIDGQEIARHAIVSVESVERADIAFLFRRILLLVFCGRVN